jgi:hypothetical protein
VTQLTLPTARSTDPSTSGEAAASVRVANSALVATIRIVLRVAYPRSLTQEQIAERVEHVFPHRWTQGTVVTACKRANLVASGTTTNRRGRRVILWSLG